VNNAHFDSSGLVHVVMLRSRRPRIHQFSYLSLPRTFLDKLQQISDFITEHAQTWSELVSSWFVSSLIRRHNMQSCMIQSRFSKSPLQPTFSLVPLPFPLSVLRSHEISHGLWLALKVVRAICICMAVMIVMTVAIILRSNIFQLVDAATLWTTLNRAVARCCQPDDIVRVDWETSAAEVLLVTKRLDGDRVVESSCSMSPSVRAMDLPYDVHDESAYPCAMRPMASCRRRRCPAFCPKFPIARDRWPGRDRWGWFLVYHRRA
jgi:hypothetical protein